MISYICTDSTVVDGLYIFKVKTGAVSSGVTSQQKEPWVQFLGVCEGFHQVLWLPPTVQRHSKHARNIAKDNQIMKSELF